jgi:hypothetical protein
MQEGSGACCASNRVPGHGDPDASPNLRDDEQLIGFRRMGADSIPDCEMRMCCARGQIGFIRI